MFFSSIRNRLSRALGRQKETNPFGGDDVPASKQVPTTSAKQSSQKQVFQDISFGNDTLFK